MSATVVSVLPTLTGYSHQCLDASVVEQVGITSAASALPTITVVMSTSTDVACAVAPLVVENGVMLVGITVANPSRVDDIITAFLQSLVHVGLPILTYDGTAMVWVTNTDTKASFRYSGYDYNSYSMFDGKYIAAKSDGIYVLEGATDAGVPVQSMVDFGDLDFGAEELKHVTNAYIGIASDGYVYLKVLVEGAEYVYRSRDFSEVMQTQRIDVGRGLRATLFGFELYGNGAHMDLRSVSFVAVPTKRRI